MDVFEDFAKPEHDMTYGVAQGSHWDCKCPALLCNPPARHPHEWDESYCDVCGDKRPDDHVDMARDIADFHERFGLAPNTWPGPLSDEMQGFRTGFMAEELGEYAEAVLEGDMAKAHDALIDLVYVAMGTAYLHRFRFAEGWQRVHAANMAKVRAERADQSLRGTAFDVVKPEGWEPADLRDISARWWTVFLSDGDRADFFAYSKANAIEQCERRLRDFPKNKEGVQIEEAFPRSEPTTREPE